MVVGPAVGDDDEVGRGPDVVDAAGDKPRILLVLEHGPAAAGVVAGVAGGSLRDVGGALEDLRDPLPFRIEIFRLDVGFAHILVGAAGFGHEFLVPVVVVLKRVEGLRMIERVGLDDLADILVVADALGFLGAFAGGTQRGHRQSSQDHDDGDHDQQLDQRVMAACLFSGGHNLKSSMMLRSRVVKFI